MAMMKTLLANNDLRDAWLYDTYEGMPRPTELDVSITGETAISRFDTFDSLGVGSTWFAATLEDVREGVASTGYPSDKIRFIKGKVEATIPASIPDRIAILRLDTDWYESTKHELIHLFPRLSPGGLLIVDDYGSWQGARKATDEFMAEHCPDAFVVSGAGGIGYATKPSR